MFEKIFGIFRKRKRADISQQIPGEMDEEMFDIGDAEMGDEFDADTISLETGMSDGGFSSSGGMGPSGPDMGEAIGVTEPPLEEELGFGLESEEEGIPTGRDEFGIVPEEGPPISPPPDVEAFAPPRRKRNIMAILPMIGIAVIGFAIGFLGTTEAARNMVAAFLSSEPTIPEKIEQFKSESAEIEKQLVPYRAVGTIDEILAVQNELKQRQQIAEDITAIDAKIANRSDVEDRIDSLAAQLAQTKIELNIQIGSLANVQKAVKQIEARQDYLTSATRDNLQRIEEAEAKSEILKARLTPDRIERAETEAYLSRDLQEGVARTSLETLSSQ